MTRTYTMRFRDFPSFTPERRATILEALAVGAPVEIACESAGIVKITYYRWIRTGKALYFDEDCPYTPHFAPRQSKESDADFEERQYEFDCLCAELEDFFLATLETPGEARFQLCKRMYERAMAGSFFAIRFLLERPGRKYYSLSPYFRKSGDIEVESTSKGDAMLFAEAFAVLSHPRQSPALLESSEIDDNCCPASSRHSENHNGASPIGAEPNGTAGARNYKSLFRDFPSFTPECRAKILEALAVCTPVEIACERAGIVKSTYYRWIRIGKALHLGEDCSDIPHFEARQLDEYAMNGDAVLNHPFPWQVPVPTGPQHHDLASKGDDPAAEQKGHDHALQNGAG